MKRKIEHGGFMVPEKGDMGPDEASPVTTAWKLFRKRRDGTLGPLFINRQLVIRKGIWMPAEDHPTKGYAHRPGWHCAPAPQAPHLTLKGRIWVKVEIHDFCDLVRPESQGGTWWLAKWLRVVDIPE